MSKTHLKIEHPEIGNRCHNYQNVRTRCHLQGATLSEVYFMSMHHLWTFWVKLGCDIDKQFTATWTNFWTQNQSDQNGKPVQLLEGVWQYHVHCRPKRPICGWKRSPRWTQMVMTCRMTVILLTFARWGMWVVVGPYGGNMKNWRFCTYGNFGDKNHRFHLPARYIPRGAIAFPGT